MSSWGTRFGSEAPVREAADGTNANDLTADTRLVNLIRSAVEAASDVMGRALLGAVGSNIANQATELDARTYGYDLVAALPMFELVERRQGDRPAKVPYIRNKPKRVSLGGGDHR